MFEVEKLKLAIEKNASTWNSFTNAFKGIGKTLGSATIAAGGAAAAATVGHGVGMGIEALRDRIGKGQAYKGMLKLSPNLAKRRDADKVQLTFNTLWNLNRDLAKDPLTASSFVERSVQRADIGDSAGSYVDIETARNLLRSVPKQDRPITQAFIQGGTSAFVHPPKKDYEEERKLEQYKSQLREKAQQAYLLEKERIESERRMEQRKKGRNW